MRDPVQIGRCYSLPIRPVRRSFNEGFQGDWTAWSGTKRQLLTLAEADRRDAETRWGFRYVFMFAAGFVLALLVVAR